MPMVIRAGKYEGMMPLFSVDYYDPKTLPFNFSNDILITLEMPRYPTKGPFGESSFRCYSVHLLQRSLVCVGEHVYGKKKLRKGKKKEKEK